MKKPVILDVDTGSDDAVAILLALLAKDLEVTAICTSWGNVDIDHTTDNTLRIISAMGLNVPVYRGLSNSLVKNLYDGRRTTFRLEAVVEGEIVELHAGTLDLPETERQAEAMPAVFFYKQALTDSLAGLDIITTGPLTNLAVVLSLWPELAKKINSLTCMGGGHMVYNEQHGEGNFWHDPESAQIILDSGVMPTLVPLDATHQAVITADEIAALRAQGSMPAKFAADLLDDRRVYHNQNQPLPVADAATLHDAVAVAAFIDPAVLTDVKTVHIDIGFSGASDGHCSFDRREGAAPPNCHFALGADRERFVQLVLNTYGEAVK